MAASPSNVTVAAPASTITHSACGWSYQKSGALAWPRETMRSMRTVGADTSVVISSRASCGEMSANRLPLSLIAAAVSSHGRKLERLREKLIGAPARGVVVDHGGDHHLVRLGRGDERDEARENRRRRAGEQAGAALADALPVDRRVVIRRGLLGAGERQILAARAPHEIEIDRCGEALGLCVAVRRDR